MQIKTLFGLPAHPLIVHVPVVLLPLAAVGAVLAVLFRRLRSPFGWTVVVLTAVSTVFAKLAEPSGRALQEAVPGSDALRQHVQLGDSMWLFAGFFFGWALLLMLWDRYVVDAPSSDGAAVARPKALQRLQSLPSWVGTALAVLVVLSGALATVRVIQVGHSGAKATWQTRTPALQQGGDEGRDGGGADRPVRGPDPLRRSRTAPCTGPRR